MGRMNHLEVNLKTNMKSVAYIYISSFYSLASFCVILVIWTILGANLSLEACFCKGLKNPNSGKKVVQIRFKGCCPQSSGWINRKREVFMFKRDITEFKEGNGKDS